MASRNASGMFLQKLSVQYPIIQAPMARTATPELAAAVSNACGVGSIGIGAASVEQAREMISQTRTLTDRPFNVNVFCHQPPEKDSQRDQAWIDHFTPVFEELGAEVPTEIEEIDSSFLTNEYMFQMFLEEKPAIVSFHFGLPPQQKIDALKDAGITLFATATSLGEARVLEAAGVDAIVAQGIEAGGHRGIFDPDGDDQRLPTSVLVRTLVAKQSLPVIAAGGIMDGRGIRAALDLGAAAAQLGTAFVLCPESAANDGYRDMLRSERAHYTMLTPVLTGRPARAMVNRLITHGSREGSPLPSPYPNATSLSRKLNEAADQTGSTEYASHWAGQGAPLAREMPATELVSTLVQELSAT